jgi:hypothetical protein
MCAMGGQEVKYTLEANAKTRLDCKFVVIKNLVKSVSPQ